MTRNRKCNQSIDSGGPDANANGVSTSIIESLQRLGPALPKLVAFDLDYTLWPFWVDTHVDTPIKRKGEAYNKAIDRYGTTMSLFPHVPSILFYLRSQGVTIAAASRTSAPSAARQALQGLVLIDPMDESSEPVKAISFFTQQEIYPGSKIAHFRSLHAKTSISYQEMLFFDDEHRNAEVGKLGVHFQLVSHQGTDLATFERGIREWRAGKKAREGDTDAGAELLK